MTKSGPGAPPRHEEVFKRVGEALRAARERAGLTQAEVGARLGMQQQTVFLFERGRTNMTINTLARFAEVLGVDVRDLLPQSGGPPLALVAATRLREMSEQLSTLIDTRRREDEQLAAVVEALQRLGRELGLAVSESEKRGGDDGEGA